MSCRQHTLQQCFGGMLIAPLLHQNVKDDAVFVDCSPEPVACALDLELHLIQMPFVTRVCTAPTQSSGVARAELRAPGSDRLVRDGDPPLGQQLLDVAQAEKTVVIPTRCRTMSCP